MPIALVIFAKRRPLYHIQRKPQWFRYAKKTGGETGIRTLGTQAHNGFRDRPVRPLRHLSAVILLANQAYLTKRGFITALVRCGVRPHESALQIGW